MIYTFTIHGNQEDMVNGNAIPYKRVLKQHMRKESVRYHDWLDYVRGCFYDYAAKNKIQVHGMKQPILLNKTDHCRMDILIGWANGHHGDNDNTWKGIADALFVNDKDIDGSFAGVVSPLKRGYVHITIKINEQGSATIPSSDEKENKSRNQGTFETSTRLPEEAGAIGLSTSSASTIRGSETRKTAKSDHGRGFIVHRSSG
jgi:hypothetical protein